MQLEDSYSDDCLTEVPQYVGIIRELTTKTMGTIKELSLPTEPPSHQQLEDPWDLG
jgi:hypothetical protein